MAKREVKNSEPVMCIKVALPENLRNSAKEKLTDFGREVPFNKLITERSNSKLSVLGRFGFMTVEDYEKGNFAPYGITPEIVKGFTEMDNLRKENDRLQKLLLEKDAKEMKPKAAKIEPDPTHEAEPEEETKQSRKSKNIEKLKEGE